MNAPAAHLQQAATLIGEGRIDDARALLMRHARPGAHPHTYHLLAIASEIIGETERAVFYAHKAALAAPNDPDLALGLSQRLFIADKIAQSLAALTAFAARTPLSPAILSARIGLLTKLRRAPEAVALAESAPEPVRFAAPVAEMYAGALQELGRLDDALSVSRRAGRAAAESTSLLLRGRIAEGAIEQARLCAAFPADPAAWTTYASTLNYVQDTPLSETLRAHVSYGRALRAQLGPARTTWNVSPDPDRPLRVGILSPDLRQHAIVSFLAPLLEHFDRSQWHLTAYSTSLRADAVTARLKSLAHAWRWFPTGSLPALLRRLTDDRIDVLIELSGHTEGHRLDAMHLRPAPVQATYLGYPNTTGLDSIDLRIVDSITDPLGTEQWATEPLARIDPCFLCFKPIVDAPELAPPPSAAPAPIAFGSFNLPKKISPRTLALWGRLLAALPGSTLVLKHAVLTQDWMRTQLSVRLADAGIDPARITILPPAPAYADHLAAYAHIDVALDTYPYHGTTTTCESLWMGVPVITLLGDRHASRVGASLLTAVGLSDLIAPDEAAFVRIGAALAADLPRRAVWRTPGPASLRALMAASPLCDGPAFAARFQSAIRAAWRSWCARAAAPSAAPRANLPTTR